MSPLETTPFKLNHDLTDYLPLPRAVFAVDKLSPRAKLAYALLLDRATLSRKNGYANSDGAVFVLFSRENLANALNVSVKMVSTYLHELETSALIRREKTTGNGPSHIYLMLPPGSIKVPAQGTKRSAPGNFASIRTGKKLPPNDLRQQQNLTDYYQHGEDESL